MMDETKTKELAAFIISTLIFALPAIHQGFDWLRTIIPLIPFYYCLVLGEKEARRLIGLALGLSALLGLLLGNFSSSVYALLLLPAGFSLARSGKLGRSPAWSGGVTTLLVLLAWLFGGLLQWTVTDINPYQGALTALDQGFETMATTYQGQDMGAEMERDIQRAIAQARAKMPAIFPAILVMAALVVSWLNLVIGNRLLRKGGKNPPWPRFRNWRLPDNLIWLLIAATSGLIVFSGSLGNVFLNMVLVLISIYVIQGLAVLQAMFKRWSVPILVRAIIYALIGLQTFSVPLLAVLGVMDIWKDLGNIYPDQGQQPS
ncbi:MAG: DUF2232 domain-containing protein [Thermodesulfobacteriota bacterium]